MEKRWQIQVLGRLAVTGASGTIERFRTRRAALLLARLALTPGRVHARDTLIEALWPEVDPAVGRQNLRQTLHTLRQTLGPDCPVAANHDGVWLVADLVLVDAVEFERELDRAARRNEPDRGAAALRQALEFYRGELLPSSYDDWAIGERNRLAARYDDALRQLSTLYEQQGRRAQALETTLHLLARRPEDEESRQAALRLFVALGDLEGARELARQIQMHGPLSDVCRRLLEAAPSPRSPLNLPPTAGRFFGRAADLDAVCERLASGPDRLITLVGPGGIGKTRLAIEGLHRVGGTFARIAFVGLDTLTEVEQIPQAILSALGKKGIAGRDPVAAVALALAEPASTLLALDNAEHLLAEPTRALATLIRTLLAATPDLKVLATSRRRLGIEREVVLDVPPLSTPAVSLGWEALIRDPSGALFVDRAQQALPGFHLGPGNAGVVGRICAALDGVPLALELAASWTARMDLERMESDLAAVLERTRPGSQDRHRSLNAALAWSVGLLPQEAQRLLAHLWVFQGGFTAPAASAIVAQEPLQDESDPIDALSPQTVEMVDLLREHSLVLVGADPVSGAIRYHLLEPVRQFARSLLPSDRDAIEERHARYYSAYHFTQQQLLYGPRHDEAIARMECEWPNLLVMLEWLRVNDGAVGQRRVHGMTEGWVRQGDYHGSMRWVAAMLETTTPDPYEYTQTALLYHAGRAPLQFGDRVRGLALVDQALARFRLQNDVPALVTTLTSTAIDLMERGQFSLAEPYLDEAGRRYEEWPEQERRARYRITLLRAVARREELEGDLAAARATLQECVDRAHRLEIPWLLLPLRERLASVWCLDTPGYGALEFSALVLDEARAAPRPLFVAALQTARARHLGRLGRFDEAHAALVEALAGWRTMARLFHLIEAAQELAPVLVGLGRLPDAALLLGAIDHAREATDHPLLPRDRPLVEKTWHTIVDTLGPDALTQRRHGRSLEMERLLHRHLEPTTT